MKKLSLFFISLLLLTSCGGGTSNPEESFVFGSGAVTFISENERNIAPSLSGKTLAGDTFKAPEGKILVLNVWASWCSPCRAEAPTLQALSQKYEQTQFVGLLTRDNQANARAFVRKVGITYPTLVDDALLVGLRKTLPANAIPSTLIIDKEGRVAARISGEVRVSSLSKIIEKVSAE